MPEMDGYELCTQIKNNIETSHIPVIMLTARVSAENRMQGYNTGADSYIDKPVNLELLSIRVRSLLEQRNKLQSYFKSGVTLEPETIKLTSVDEKFVIKAKEIIERNIDNPDFNVNQFVKEMGTSNSILYRKLTTMIGMSPVEFIKNMRLKRAVQLLKEQKFTISEVAYATGFNDTSYFTVCFKKQFGITPSDFVDSVVKNEQ
jgi:AraC-like DNA-binding protein